MKLYKVMKRGHKGRKQIAETTTIINLNYGSRNYTPEMQKNYPAKEFVQFNAESPKGERFQAEWSAEEFYKLVYENANLKVFCESVAKGWSRSTSEGKKN